MSIKYAKTLEEHIHNRKWQDAIEFVHDTRNTIQLVPDEKEDLQLKTSICLNLEVIYAQVDLIAYKKSLNELFETIEIIKGMENA